MLAINITVHKSPLIWKNLANQVLMKIELDQYLGVLNFSPSIYQSKTRKTLLFSHFFIRKNLVCPLSSMPN